MSRLVLLAGPTASGKSRLALELAEALGGVIVNADSMQVYRELEVITARPSAADEARVPHRLYGVVSVADPFSVAAWKTRAEAEIAAAHEAGKVALVVGGTGLYFRALERGLAAIPEIPVEVRARARRLAAAGPPLLHAALAKRDPVMAARLDPADRQRLARAWEVLETTGVSLAEWQSRPVARPRFGVADARFVLMPPREWLYARCDARFADMIAREAVSEVAALEARGLDASLPAMRAVGVPELGRHVRGEAALEDAVRAGQAAVRRYAKRQLTWFRRYMAEWTVLTEREPGARARAILAAEHGALTAP